VRAAEDTADAPGTSSTGAPGPGAIVAVTLGYEPGRPGRGHHVTVPVRRRRSLGAQAAVPVSLVLVAGTAYLLLMASGRVLDAAGFAALTSFYLLANTVGRGTFAVLELELTRTVPRSRVRGESIVGPVRAVAGGGLVLLAVVCVLLLAASPWVAHVVGGWTELVLLLVAALTLAVSSLVRGPLAGDQRYGLFAATLAAESAVYLVGGAVLLVAGVGALPAWTAVLAVAPLVGALTAAVTPRARASIGRVLRPAGGRDPAARVGLPTLLAGSALYLFSQAVWNLGPVLATGRTTDGVLAAAFAASAVLLRAPVMAFPAVQALVLPRLAAAGPGTGARRATSRLVAVGVAAAVVWVVGSVLVAPPVIRVFFAVSETPARGILAALALSVAVGLVAQGTQTRLLAAGRTVLVSASWAVGTVVLVVPALVVPDAVLGAALGQLLAAVVVLATQVVALRRSEK
jgi:O-antigen/teichoic acid export membrane protein